MIKHRRRLIALLLAVIYLTDGMLVGVAHRHCHEAGESHAHAAHIHDHHAAEIPGQQSEPGDESHGPHSPVPRDDDDCVACRYLAQASLLLEYEAEVVSPAPAETVLAPRSDHYDARPLFIRRARAPPAAI
jgi:hypothetical protein